jgi:hypothetical protein
VSTLTQQGATDSQIEAWKQQNAALFQAQRQRAQQLSAYAFFQPLDDVTDVDIAENASQEESDFLVTQASLQNNFAQIHNQLLQAQGSTFTLSQVSTLSTTEVDLFTQQNAIALATQVQRAKDFGDLALHQPLEDLAPALIPANANPTLQAFLILHEELAQEQIDLHNQYCTATTAQLQAAEDLWHEQNSVRFEQLSQLAIGVAQINAAIPIPIQP